jgi:hypothetical protein
MKTVTVAKQNQNKEQMKQKTKDTYARTIPDN